MEREREAERERVRQEEREIERKRQELENEKMELQAVCSSKLQVPLIDLSHSQVLNGYPTSPHCLPQFPPRATYLPGSTSIYPCIYLSVCLFIYPTRTSTLMMTYHVDASAAYPRLQVQRQGFRLMPLRHIRALKFFPHVCTGHARCLSLTQRRGIRDVPGQAAEARRDAGTNCLSQGCARTGEAKPLFDVGRPGLGRIPGVKLT